MMRSLPIRHKLIVLVVGICCPLIIFSSLFFLTHESLAFLKQNKEDLSALSAVIADNASAPLSFNDQEDANDLLASLRNAGAIEYACIYRADGSILAEYAPHGVPSLPLEPREGCALVKQYRGGLVSCRPVSLKHTTLGSLCIVTNNDALMAQLIWSAVMVVGLIVLSGILAWFLASRLQRAISEPVISLAHTAELISERHDYSLRASKRSDDEIGALTDAFNDMICAVEDSSAALVESNRTFTRLSDNLVGAFLYRFNTNGMFTWVSSSVTSVLGYAPAEFVTEYSTFLTDHPVNEFALEKAELSRKGIVQAPYELQILAKDGETHWLEVGEVPVLDSNGEVVLVEGFAHDVTERREASNRENELRDKLARAERMKSLGVLAGGVAHDLNNMLGPMLLLPEIMQEDLQSLEAPSNNPEALTSLKDGLSVVQESAQRGAAVVRDLLTMGRRVNASHNDIDLNDIVQGVRNSEELANLVRSAVGKDVVYDLYEGVLLVSGSDSQLSRCVYNLVRNATEAIDGEGTVTVRTNLVSLSEPKLLYEVVPQGTYATIEVSDNGQGIDATILERIFDPFFTSKAKTNRSGSGLGLSVVHGCTKDHDGFINVTSAKHVGTTFTIYIPTVTAMPIEQHSDDENQVISRGTESIMVLDDEPGQRFLAKTGLSRLGYQVTTTGDPEEGLAMHRAASDAGKPAPFDLLLLDFILAENATGVDVYKKILELFPHQKAVIVSGHAPEESASKAQELGASWLEKPYALHKLAITVRHKLDSV